MKKAMSKAAVIFLLLFLTGAMSCIMETKVMDVVLTDETCIDSDHYSEDEIFTDIEIVDYAAQIDTILWDNQLSREDIISAHLVSASYRVTEFSQDTDWEISGAITVRRMDITHGPDTIVVYTEQSIMDALGDALIPAVLHPAGVAVIDSALYDYIHKGRNPIFEFVILNGDVEPDPSPVGTTPGPIDFSWQACIEVHVVTEHEGDYPDVF